MKILFFYLAILTFFTVSPAAGQEASTAVLDGNWIGELAIGKKRVFMRLSAAEKDGKTTVLCDVPSENVFETAAENFKIENGRINFSVALKSQTIAFAGNIENNKLWAVATAKSLRGKAEFVKLADVSAALKDEYTGTYRIANDRLVTLGAFDEVGGNLTFLDLKTRRTGVLLPVSQTEFISGPTITIGFPAEIRVRFERGAHGKVSGVVWQDADGKMQPGVKVYPHRREDVSFRNGDVNLRGTLLIPEGAGRFPAVVLAHGSGAATRNVAFFQTFFVARGIAVLSYDKRGAGESTGDWRTSSFDELANDVTAGIDFLKSRPDIDAQKIGVHGSSQGGWIGAIVAARRPDLAFLIVRVGPGVDVVRTVARENGGYMREEKMSPEFIAEGEDFSRRIGYMAARGANWEEIDALFQTVKDKPWAKHTFPAGLKKDSYWWRWYRLNGRYDSAAYLKKVKNTPVLWLLGEHDQNLPVSESAGSLRAALAEAENQDYAVEILPRTGHGFLVSDTGFNSELATQKFYTDGYWNRMAEWLDKRVGRPLK